MTIAVNWDVKQQTKPKIYSLDNEKKSSFFGYTCLSSKETRLSDQMKIGF